jgi:hypothetical protein
MRAFSVRRTFALCASLLALAALPATANATSTQVEIDAAVDKAVEYLRSGQDTATGAIPGFGGEWALTALAAAGVDAAEVHGPGAGDPSLQDYWHGTYSLGLGAEDPPLSPASDYENAILISHAAGLDPARLAAGSNLPAQLAGRWNPAAGSFGEPSTYTTVFGILAMRATPLPTWALAPVASFLRRNQHDDGGWAFTTALTPVAQAEPSEEDMTGAAIAALCGAGVPAYDPTVSSALAFLRDRLINATGGIEYAFGPNSDVNAWVISGLIACGIDPQSPEWTTSAGKTPVDFLLSLQVHSGAETGGFGYSDATSANLYSSQDALRALAGAGFTVSPVSTRPAPSVAADTPTPHLLAIELAPGNVRICKVTAPESAPLTEVLAAAESASHPEGCVSSLSVAAGEVESIGGVAPEGEDEAWLARLDRGPAKVAAEQPVGFGDVVSLRLGQRPITPVDHVASPATIVVQAPGGPTGQRGKRGPKGKRGRHAKRCKVGGRKAGKRRKRCRARHARGTQPRAMPASKPLR